MQELPAKILIMMVILTLSISLALKSSSPLLSNEQNEKGSLSHTLSMSEPTVPQEINDKNFKSWMDYRTITDETSAQYTLQQDASTGLHGIRYYAGLPMIAIGTGWGASVGDYVIVQFEDRTPMGCIVGDIKSDVHTDSTHRWCLVNGSVIEFIVDSDYISQTTKITGSFTNIYPSPVTNIYQEALYENY
jgi:hypothetical protein